MGLGVMRKTSLKRWHLLPQNKGLFTLIDPLLSFLRYFSPFNINFEIVQEQYKEISTSPSPKFPIANIFVTFAPLLCLVFFQHSVLLPLKFLMYTFPK